MCSLFLPSLLCSVGLFVCLCFSATWSNDLIILTLQRVLKLGGVNLPALTLYFKIALAIYRSLGFPYKFYLFIFIFKYILLIILLQLSHFFLLYPPLPCTPSPTSIPSPPPWFMSMGCTYKFFGFPIFHTILNLPLSILYLSFMFLIPCTIYPILFPSPPH